MTADRREVGGVDDERVILFIFLSLSPLHSSHRCVSSLSLRPCLSVSAHVCSLVTPSPSDYLVYPSLAPAFLSLLFLQLLSIPQTPSPTPSLPLLHPYSSLLFYLCPSFILRFVHSFILSPRGQGRVADAHRGRLLALPPEYEVQKLPWAL